MTESVAQELRHDYEEDTQKGKFLTFTTGDETYGIEIKYVTEIIGLQPITEVPQLPNYSKGIINLRGKIIPVMDVRLRFKKPIKEYDGRTCIVVINIKQLSIGLIVDCVSEVLSISDDNIVPPPNLNNVNNRYIKAIGKVQEEVKLILDCNKIINEEDVKILITNWISK